MKTNYREAALLDQAVRLHYLSLEGSGKFEEALFFLEWHNGNGEGHRHSYLTEEDHIEIFQAQRVIGGAARFAVR